MRLCCFLTTLISLYTLDTSCQLMYNVPSVIETVNPKRSIDSIKSILPNLSKQKQVDNLNILIALYDRIRDTSNVQATAKQSIVLAKSIGYEKGLAKAIFFQAWLHLDTDKEKVMVAYNAALAILQSIDAKEDIAYVLMYRAGLYKHNQFHLVEQDLRNSIKLYETVSNYGLAANVYTFLGTLYDLQNNIVEEVKCYFSALKIYERIGKKDGMASCYNNLGYVYMNLENFEMAMKYFQASVDVVGSTTDFYQLAGINHQKSKNYKEALRIFDNILFKSERGKSLSWRATICYWKGITYFDWHNDLSENKSFHDEALRYRDSAVSNFSNAKELYLRLNHKTRIAYSLEYLGKIEFRKACAAKKTSSDLNFVKSTFAATKGLFLQALSLTQSINLHIQSGKLCYQLAELEFIEPSEINSHDSIIKYVEKGMEYAKLSKEYSLMSSISLLLSNYYKKTKNFDQALQQMTSASTYKDSALKNDNRKQLERLITQYEIEKGINNEKYQHEKTLISLANKTQLEMSREKARQEQLLSEQRHSMERIALEDKMTLERKLADETYQLEKEILEEKNNKYLSQLNYTNKTNSILMGSGLMIMILTLTGAMIRNKMLRKRGLERAQAKHRIVELELQSLRTQLNPHFMFNALNAIQELILLQENKKSHSYLSKFSKLVRILLDNATSPFVPISKELEFLELYMSLENLRVPDLQYRIEMDPAIDRNSLLIPNMILQPYIENAIWHGLYHKEGEKHLRLGIRLQNDVLLFQIEDSGIGRIKSSELNINYRTGHKSKGLELLSKRFKLLATEYGTVIKTEITDKYENGSASGTLVEIRMPFDAAEKRKIILYDQVYNN